MNNQNIDVLTDLGYSKYGIGHSNIEAGADDINNSFGRSSFDAKMERLNTLNQSPHNYAAKDLAAQDSNYTKQLSDTLHPQSYFNDRQVYTTDYANNYPDNYQSKIDVVNYNPMYRNYLYPKQDDINRLDNPIERDVDYYFNRDKDDLCHNEGGFVPYAYLDTAATPNATIGCGINIDQTPNIQLYHAQTGQPLSKEELDEEIKKLQSSEHGKLHTYYEDKSNIRIAPQENDRIMKEKYVDGYNYVNGKYPDFPVYIEDRQKALMDMVYGLGTPRFSKYTDMRDAILQNDWKRAANEAWRCGVGFDRNKQTVDRMYPGLYTKEMSDEHCKGKKKK